MAPEYRYIAATAYGGKVVLPGSIVVAKKEGQDEFGNDQWEVLQYSLTFGLRWVHLKKVPAEKECPIELDQKEFWKNFNVIQDSNNTDHFGLQLPVEKRYWESARTGTKESCRL